MVSNDGADKASEGNALALILEGGLPQLMLGPAGKSLSRFLGMGVDTLGAALWEWPKAAIEQKAQAIKDQTAASSAITLKVAEQVAAIAANDPNILGRGLENWLDKTYRAQSNKEAIAGKAFEQLMDTPPPDDAEEINQDWLNVFSRYAEDASSERLQNTFAQILAGETRMPGCISLATVQFLSILDQRTAAAIDKSFAWAIDGSGLLRSVTDDYDTFVTLRDAGIVGTHIPDMQLNLAPKDNAVSWEGAFTVGPVRLLVDFSPNTKFQLNMIALSRVGQELFRVIPITKNDQAINAAVDAIKATGAKSIHLAVPDGNDGASKGPALWISPD